MNETPVFNKRSRLRLVAGAVLAGGLAISLGFALTRVSGAAEPLPPLSTHVAAVDRGGTPTVSLPAAAQSSPTVNAWVASVDRAHLVLSNPRQTLWAAEGKFPNTLCLLEKTRGWGEGVGINCAARVVLERGPQYLATQVSQGDPWDVYGLVSDEVSAVQGPDGRRVRVRNNAFAIYDIPDASTIHLKLVTAAGERPFLIDGLHPHIPK